MAISEDIAAYLDADWYLRRHPDIAEAGVDPFRHFMDFGLAEHRDANPVFDQKWYAAEYLNAGELAEPPLVHYARTGREKGYRPNAFVDLDFIREEYDLSQEDDVLAFLVARHGSVDKINAWFSRSAYLSVNRDLTSALPAPEVHFWIHGIAEGRSFDEGLSFKTNDAYIQTSPFERLVAEVSVSGREFGVVTHKAPDDILRKIREQAEIEPDIVAAGVPCLPYLPKYDATDLKTRDGIEAGRILDEISSSPDAIIIMPRLQLGGSDKYAAQLAWGLSRSGAKSVMIITTDSWGADDRAALELEGLAGYREFKIVSLRDSIGGTHNEEMLLALLLLTARPKFLFTMNSDLAFRVVKSYGKQLGGNTKIFCAFFSESPNAVGAPYSARYLRHVVPHAYILSDNKPALKTWGDRLGGSAEDRLVLLPPMVRRIGPEGALTPSAVKPTRAGNAGRHALWISRWEPFKAIDVLLEIAKKDPLMEIDAFGPVQDPEDAQDLPPNIKMRGVLKDPTRLLVERYDVMLFTSYFEGMPNIVLEMAAMGIPIVASDVGGLRDTFPDGTIELVTMEGSRADMAERFLRAANKISAEPQADRAKRLERTRDAVMTTHGSENFLRLIRKMIGTEHV